MSKKPFTCPKCGYADSEFHTICPECSRPFMRDYADTRIHPRDPDLTGPWAGLSLACLLHPVFSDAGQSPRWIFPGSPVFLPPLNPGHRNNS
jgi:hypothetical protein